MIFHSHIDQCHIRRKNVIKNPGPCITNVFATRRKNFSQWHRSFQRKLRSHWLKFLRHVAKTLVIQGPVTWIFIQSETRRHIQAVPYVMGMRGTQFCNPILSLLTHWGRVTDIYVSNINTIGSNNGLSPGRHQAIIGTNAGILLIWSLGTNFSVILIDTHTFSFATVQVFGTG